MMNPSDLQHIIPMLVPTAIAWAEARSVEIQSAGAPLDMDTIELASKIGVAKPERVRIVYVDRVPLPEDPSLRSTAIATGLLGADTAGLTLGYGIYICGRYFDRRLLSHELRHVYQYEQAGGIAAFLQVYLMQIADFGYDLAPIEVDARAHELY